MAALGARRLAVAASILTLAIAAGLALLALFGEPFPYWTGALRIASLFAAPGALGLLALRGRPALLVVAAITPLALAMLSASLATLALVIPGVAFLVAHARWQGSPRASVPPVVTGVVVAALAVGELWVPLGPAAPACWEVRTGTGGREVVREIPPPRDGVLRVGPGIREVTCTTHVVRPWEMWPSWRVHPRRSRWPTCPLAPAAEWRP